MYDSTKVSDNLISMTIREYIGLPTRSEFILAGIKESVGDRFRLSDEKTYEESLLKLAYKDITEVPLLVITQIGMSEKGIPEVNLGAEMVKITGVRDV